MTASCPTLRVVPYWNYMREELTAAVVRAIRRWPFSQRSLSRTAGCSHTTLQRLLRGDVGATHDTARAILSALDERSAELASLADPIREALKKVEEKGG